MYTIVTPPVYKAAMSGFEPKNNTLIDTFREKIDETVNKMLYGHYRDPSTATEILLHNGKDRYFRAGLVQWAVEKGYRVKCRLIRRAIDDIGFAIKDEAFLKDVAGDYVLIRIARETKERMEKIAHGHNQQCPQDCMVKI